MTNTDPLASSSVIEIVISQEQVGIRLDKVLSQLPEFTSRSRVAQLFSEGRVCRGNKLLKASYIPQLHEIIRIHLPFQVMEAEEIKPYQFPLDILFEDEDLLVMVRAQATSEPAPEPRPGPTGTPLDFDHLMKSATMRKYPGKPIWIIVSSAPLGSTLRAAPTGRSPLP